MTIFPTRVSLWKGGIHGAGVETQPAPDGPACSSPFLHGIALPGSLPCPSPTKENPMEIWEGKRDENRHSSPYHEVVQAFNKGRPKLTASWIHHLNSVTPRWPAGPPETEPAPQASVSFPAASGNHGADANPWHCQSQFILTSFEEFWVVMG